MFCRTRWRIAFWYAYLTALFDKVRPEYVTIEDYAYRATQLAYRLGSNPSLGPSQLLGNLHTLFILKQ